MAINGHETTRLLMKKRHPAGKVYVDGKLTPFDKGSAGDASGNPLGMLAGIRWGMGMLAGSASVCTWLQDRRCQSVSGNPLGMLAGSHWAPV